MAAQWADTSMTTDGDLLARAVLKRHLLGTIDVHRASTDLFTVASEHDGLLLDQAVAIAAEATGDHDPSWASGKWAQLIGSETVTGTSAETEVMGAPSRSVTYRGELLTLG